MIFISTALLIMQNLLLRIVQFQVFLMFANAFHCEGGSVEETLIPV
jgi:hypothetical protein